MASIICMLGWLFMADTVSAQEPEKVGSYGDWKAWTINSDEGFICYITSIPRRSAGGDAQRGEAVVLVTRRPGMPYEVSIQPGFSYRKGSLVWIDINGTGFELFTRDLHAWTKNDQEDSNLLSMLLRSSDFTVRGTSSENRVVTDWYSLHGFAKAYEKLEANCQG